MAWKQVCVLDERVEFTIRAMRGECLSGLCREFEISRPTGYRLLRRFREGGVTGIADRGSAARAAGLGARKLAVLLARQGQPVPAITIHRVLRRHGLVSVVPCRSGPLRARATQSALADGLQGS